MKPKAFYLSLLLSVLISQESLKADTPLEILFPGSYHGDEVSTDSPGTWWAICDLGNTSRLTAVVVRTEAVNDPIVDDEFQKTGVNVVVSGCEKPVLLIRNLQGAKERQLVMGKVEQATEDSRKVITKFNNDVFIIEEEKEGLSKGLVLTSQGKKQVIYSSDYVEPGWGVDWIGDLDADGKADFLINASDHYNVMESRLFLSAGAPNGDLVWEAALLHTVGC